jgi:hypothetical protein
VVSTGDLHRLWEKACVHAGYQVGSDVRLYPLPGPPEGDRSAFHLEPGTWAEHEPALPFDHAQLRDANLEKHRDLHRVAIRDVEPERVLLGLLRHELEHARQYDQSPGLYRFMCAAEDAVSRAFYRVRPPALEGSAAVYNALPHERDANYASSALTLEVFGPPTAEDLEGPDAQLYRETRRCDPGTLAIRLISVCAMFPDDFAEACSGRSRTTGDALRELAPVAPRWWSTLRAGAGSRELGGRALAAVPSVEAVWAAPSPPAAWLPVVELIGEAQALGARLLTA